MARNDGIDRTTVRNANLTKSQIANVQHHNEREKSAYVNPDIVTDRIHMNVHYKRPTDNYEEMFNIMKEDGTITTRGLKQDAKIFGELIFDVNSAYFYNHGGYKFAKEYYEEAYKAAIEIVGGEEYILSAVMHADERNKAMSEALGEDIYHYHMHVVYIPVVEKQVLWTKRCKDPSLVGTVKETIMQVSSSKKWDSKPALDEAGNPILQKNGKAVLKKSYSVLQDDYFKHMYDAGYHDIQRGEYGSTEEHLTVTQYKVEKEKARLEELKDKERRLENVIKENLDEAKEVTWKVQEAQSRLEEMAPILDDTEALANKFRQSPEDFLPEAGSFETGKSYREKKAIPVFEKIVEVLRSLNRKYWELRNDYNKLGAEYNYQFERNEALVRTNRELKNENEKLKGIAQNFRRVQQYFGADKVTEAIGIVKQKEAEMRTQKRKIPGRER